MSRDPLNPLDSWRSPWRWLWLAPWAMLALNALCWLVLGSDLPFVDDWRAYADGTAGRWVPAHWFTAMNNTMAPVGLALDALAQRVLAGNVLAYQFISQWVVQGGLLMGQWRLLRWALPDRRVAVLAFATTAFMLQAGSYWGEQNLAYHQALPLVFLLSAWSLGLTTTLRPAWVLLFSLGLGMLAGLSYISGAVAAVVLGISSGLLLWRTPLLGLEGVRAKAMTWGLLVAGVMTSVWQVWASRVLPTDVQGQAIPKALPTESAFWAYALGKLGRALGQGFANVRWDVVCVAAVWGLLLAALLLLAWRMLRAELTDAAGASAPTRHAHAAMQRVGLVALPLAAMVAVYLMLIAHGRANFRDAGVQSGWQIYQFGYLRFHFYWLTLVLPWCVATVAVLLAWRSAAAGGSLAVVQRRVLLGSGVLALGLLALGASRSVFDLTSHYRSSTAFRNTQWACLQAQWGSGQPIRCPTFDMADATGALLQAQALGASFTRYLPAPLGGSNQGRSLQRWQGDELQTGVWHDAQWQAGGAWLRTGHDPQWQPDVQAVPGLAQAMAQCSVLQVSVQLQGSEAGRLQVFFQPQGAAGFVEATSVQKDWGGPEGVSHAANVPAKDAVQATPLHASSDVPPLAGTLGELQTMHASWESSSGFAPSLRIDVSDHPQWVRLASVRVSCRLPTLAAWREQTAQSRMEAK